MNNGIILAALTSGLLIAGAAGCGRDGEIVAQRTEAIAAHIERLETRDWDKAVEELVRIGKPAVEPPFPRGWTRFSLRSIRANKSSSADVHFSLAQEGRNMILYRA